MSEPAAIAMQTSLGIQAIRCHTDGGIENLGRTLLSHYKTENKVRTLIARGNVYWVGKYVFPDPRKPHSFDFPQEDVTIADSRDRDEKLIRAKRYKTEEKYFADDKSFAPEVMYLFKDGRWFYIDHEQIYEGLPRVPHDLEETAWGW